MKELRIISYNVNGIRSAITKGFVEWLKKREAGCNLFTRNQGA